MLQHEISKLLVVDDDPASRYLLCRPLRQAGFEVFECETAKAAMELLERNSVDLVVLDVRLPDENGIEVCRRIKRNPETARIPVLQVSAAFTGFSDRVAALEGGADAYLVMPVEPSELQAQARALLRIRQADKAREAAERELQRQHEHARTIIDNTLAFVGVLTPEGLVMEANATALSVAGIPREEVIGRPFWDCYWWSYDPQVQAQLREAVARAVRGDIVRYDVVVRTAGNSQIAIDFMLAPVRNSAGHVTHLIPSGVDITQRKQAEDALRRSEERFRHLANAMPQLVWTADSTGTVDYYNSRAEEYRGLTQDANGKWVWQAVVHPDDLAHTQTAWLEAVRTGRMYQAEHRVQVADGSFRWHLSRALPVMNPEGEVKWFGTATDIHLQKQAEQALRESEDRFRSMADGTPLIIWVHDANAALRFVNRAYCEYFGVSPEQVIGSAWHPLIHPDDVPKYVNVFLECSRQRSAFQAQARVKVADGRWRYIESYGVPRFSDSGDFLGLAGSSVDVTERIEFQGALEKLVQERTRELRELNEQLNSFLYSVAHDLKAPLRAQSAFASILQSEHSQALGPTGLAYVRRIAEAAERQNRLIADLLSHMSVSRADLPLASVELSAVFHQAIAELTPELSRTAAHLEVRPTERRVLANTASLHLVIVSLLSNALKFVAPGVKPQVTVWSEPVSAVQPGLVDYPMHRQFVRVWVEDKGIGIPKEYAGKVFGVFQRLHTSAGYPGTGMGLAIVKRAVERMGGRVGFESDVDLGSRFWFELPAA